jgi:P27 family predicted phage terminase small subunit
MTENDNNKIEKRGRPATHGAYVAGRLDALTEQKTQEIHDLISGARTVIANTDRIAIELLARNLAKLQLFDEYLFDHGLFITDAQGQPGIQPLLKVYWQALNSATRLCSALGLTTESRLRLGLELARSQDTLERIQDEKKKQAKQDKDDNSETD